MIQAGRLIFRNPEELTTEDIEVTEEVAHQNQVAQNTRNVLCLVTLGVFGG